MASGISVVTFDTEKLISEVKTHPTLWNVTSPDYANLTKRTKAWLDICKNFYQDFHEFDISKKNDIVNGLQKKWKNLRTCFSREMKRRRNLKDSTLSLSRYKHKQYMYFEDLSFLAPHIKFSPAPIISHVGHIDDVNNDDDHEEDEDGNSNVGDEVSTSTFLPSQQIVEFEIKESIRGKRKYDSLEIKNLGATEGGEASSSGFKPEEFVEVSPIDSKTRWKKYDESDFERPRDNGEEDEIFVSKFNRPQPSEVQFKEPKKEKRKYDETDVERLCEILHTIIEQRSADQQIAGDEDRLFLLSLLKDLKDIPEDVKLLAKCEILKVISKFKNNHQSY
ncbi:UNVERIFIED_CONTAM: hypothetical protein RMT77_010189 [Armadillidium vulgare]